MKFMEDSLLVFYFPIGHAPSSIYIFMTMLVANWLYLIAN